MVAGSVSTPRPHECWRYRYDAREHVNEYGCEATLPHKTYGVDIGSLD